MAVFIFEKNAFRKIAEVEGPDYPHHQKDFGICSFKAFKNKWKRLAKASPVFVKYQPAFGIDVEGNAAIYGLGGYNRYVVLNTGEIMFLESAAESPEYTKKAEAAGFRIFARDLAK